GPSLRGQKHVPAFLIAAGAVRSRLDADLPVKDRLRAIVECREVEEIALRRPPVHTLEGVDVDALGVARGHETEQLHGRAVALDVRLDTHFRPALTGKHIQAPEIAVAGRTKPLEAEVEHAPSESANADVGDVRAGTGVDLDVRDRDARRLALRGEILDERHPAVALSDEDRARQHRVGPRGPDLLEHERLPDLDARRDVHERAPRRPERIGERAERGVRRHPIARCDIRPNEIGIVERSTEEALEDHAKCRRLRLDLELDARKMIEGRDEWAYGQVLQREPPPLLLLAGRPGFRREPQLSLEARRAQPLGLFAPKTVLLDHFGVEQQRNGYELCRTNQSHPA